MEKYVIRGGRAGYDRLQILARSWLPTTSALFDRVGLGAGMSCLDLGCGGGDVTFVLAERVGPAGRVVGVDFDDVKLGLARESAAAQGLSAVEFVTRDIYEWSDPGAFDLVYCRNVLQHLSRPVDVLRTMWEAVRPGGVIVVEDADFEGSFCEPPNAGYDFWMEKYQRVLERHGGDPLSGRRLMRRFLEAGIPAPNMSVVQRVDVAGEAKTIPHSTVEATAESIISEGIATADEVAEALGQLLALADDPTTICGSPRLFQAWSRRGST